jgi:hypothetical protein
MLVVRSFLGPQVSLENISSDDEWIVAEESPNESNEE